MKVPFFYNKMAVAIAIVAIVISTAILGLLSYYYTVGRANVFEATLVQSNIKLVEQTVARIEQKIIDNDRSLFAMADVNDRENWPAVIEAIQKADLNVDYVWFLKPDGTILFPNYRDEIRNFYGAVRTHFRDKDLSLPTLPVNEVRHLHKERRDNYFFASYVMKENRKGEKILVCFQTTLDKSKQLVDKYLGELEPTQYVRIVDFENNGVYGDLPSSGKYIVQWRFPSTFYKWILQMVPRDYAKLERLARNQGRTNFFLIILSISLIFVSLGIIYVAGRRERQLAQLKEEFISNVSHELKTPLSLIRMFSEILVLDKVKGDTTRQEYYSIIHNESERMSRLINNLLDFARLERGVTRQYFEKTNIARLVTKELEAYRYQIQKEGFQLATQVDESVPDTFADPNALTLAFFNLLDNSVKYSGDQKQITVTVGQTNGFIDLAISDCGLGIPKDEQPRIFDKFYRGSNPAVQRIRGSGIGLSITKHVAEMHGGKVLVVSEPGRGSTFTLRIPIRQAAPPASEQLRTGA